MSANGMKEQQETEPLTQAVLDSFKGGHAEWHGTAVRDVTHGEIKDIWLEGSNVVIQYEWLAFRGQETREWEMRDDTGDCIETIPNPESLPTQASMLILSFSKDGQEYFVLLFPPGTVPFDIRKRTQR